mmetsp:Transcript_13182/g.23906  ORF Transcript_13182/g.23906 Transcript_13182/m.23906 type:complete len:754 (-) Transcript_13182:84-2345(-)
MATCQTAVPTNAIVDALPQGEESLVGVHTSQEGTLSQSPLHAENEYSQESNGLEIESTCDEGQDDQHFSVSVDGSSVSLTQSRMSETASSIGVNDATSKVSKASGNETDQEKGDEYPVDLKRAIAKVHGYNNGGLEHFDKYDFDRSLKFHKRALKWAHRAITGVATELTPDSDEQEKNEPNSAPMNTSTNSQSNQVDEDCMLQKTAFLVPMTLINIGQCRLARNEIVEAKECYHEAISNVTSPPLRLPSTHPDVIRIEKKLNAVEKLKLSLSSALFLHVAGKSAEISDNYDEAIDTYQKSLNQIQELVGSVHPTVASTLHKIGIMHWKRGNYTSALAALSDSLRISVQCYGDDHPGSAEALGSTGLVHLSRGDYASAMKFYHVALRVRRDAYGDRHPDVARMLIRIGQVYDEQGKPIKAMRLYKQGLEIQRKTLESLEENEKENKVMNSGGSDVVLIANKKARYGDVSEITSLQVDVAATLNAIGVVHEKCGEFQEAMISCKEALSIYRSALGSDKHVDVAVTLNNLGQIHRHLGQYNKAMGVYQHSLEVMKTSLGDSHRNVAGTLHNIAVVHSKCGEFDQALDLYKQVLVVQREALGEEHPDLAVTLSSMGEVYEMRGDQDPGRRGHYLLAIKLYKRSLRLRRNSLGPEHYYVALTLHKIGTFHFVKDKDYRQALRRFNEAVLIYRLNKTDDTSPQLREALECVKELQSHMNPQNRKDSSSSLVSLSTGGRIHATSSYSGGCISSDDDRFNT